MPQGHAEETKLTARLPNLDIEINYSRSREGDAERLLISVQAVPSFEAFGRFLETANPFLFWMRLVQTAWAPWLGSPPAKLLPRAGRNLLPDQGSTSAVRPAPKPGTSE